LYFVKTPNVFLKIFPDVIWNCPKNRPEFHLSFDDGPSKNTDQILDVLERHNLIASFFCLGKQIEKYPDTFSRIKRNGHIIGNHGYAHLDGWKTSLKTYLEDVAKGQQLSKSRLFRPPFGRLCIKQFNLIKQEHEIVMWSLMPGDFDNKVSIETCQKRILKANSNDIIVLHDHDDSDVVEPYFS